MEKLKNLPFISGLDGSLSRKDGLINVIIGPRQVGKTTTTLIYLEDKFKEKYLYFSADGVFQKGHEWLLEKWQMATSLNKILVIDEIQKIENWSEIIKEFWDKSKIQNTEIQLILLGSSSLHIQKGLTESLAGRYLLFPAYHWNYFESNKAYGLTFSEYLKFGGYPGSYNFIKNDQWSNYITNSIISTVIEKDILLFNNIKSPALFRQAFSIIISYPAQEISYTKLLGQIQDRGNVELVKNYLRLYEGAFLIKLLEKYSKKKIKTKTSSPKILPLAPALYYSMTLSDYEKDEYGHVFEALVGASLNRTGYNLYYWREGNDEVDFILEKGKNVYAIEVKSGRNKRANGLIKFQKEYPKAKNVIITMENYFEFEKNPMEFLEKV